MKYLVLLIALGSYKFWGWRVSAAADQWFYALREKLNATFSSLPQLSMLLTLLLPIAVVGMVIWVAQDWLFGLMGIGLQVAILFYAFGRGNLLKQTKDYLVDWRAGNLQSAYLNARQYFQLRQQINVEDAESMHRAVRAGMFYQWFEQIFLIVFWYLVAGPLVALFIRLVCLYDDQQVVDEGEEPLMPLQLQHALEWLPARLTGLTFAVAGNFALCFDEWRNALFNWSMGTEEVIHRSGMAALGVCEIDGPATGEVGPISNENISLYAEEIETIQALVVRTLVIALVICALFILT